MALQERKKRNGPENPGRSPFLQGAGDQATNSAFIFFSALASTWRMRSADTP